MRPKTTSPADPRRCENCIFFCRHYVLSGAQMDRFITCYCGHCIHSNTKIVKPNHTCDGFIEKQLFQPRS